MEELRLLEGSESPMSHRSLLRDPVPRPGVISASPLVREEPGPQQRSREQRLPFAGADSVAGWREDPRTPQQCHEAGIAVDLIFNTTELK